jgi:hypothetical protein
MGRSAVRIIADTNVLVRAVLGDDPPQARLAANPLISADIVAVPLPVLCEFVWVLLRPTAAAPTRSPHQSEIWPIASTSTWIGRRSMPGSPFWKLASSGVGPYAGRRQEMLAAWKNDIAELARCPNVNVKLGGVGMTSFGFDFHEGEVPPGSEDLAAAWRQYIEPCIEPLVSTAACSRATSRRTSNQAATPSCGTLSSGSPPTHRPSKRPRSTAAPPPASTA